MDSAAAFIHWNHLQAFFAEQYRLFGKGTIIKVRMHLELGVKMV